MFEEFVDDFAGVLCFFGFVYAAVGGFGEEPEPGDNVGAIDVDAVIFSGVDEGRDEAVEPADLSVGFGDAEGDWFTDDIGGLNAAVFGEHFEVKVEEFGECFLSGEGDEEEFVFSEWCFHGDWFVILSEFGHGSTLAGVSSDWVSSEWGERRKTLPGFRGRHRVWSTWKFGSVFVTGFRPAVIRNPVERAAGVEREGLASAGGRFVFADDFAFVIACFGIDDDVGPFCFLVVHGDFFGGQWCTGAVAMHGVRGDDDVGEFVDEVGFLFVFDGGAEVDFDVFEEGAVGTGFLEFGAGFVELSDDVDIAEGGITFGALLVAGTDGDGAEDGSGE